MHIVPFHSDYIPYFDRCNREWLEDGFSVESIDEALFADPEGEIIDKGGYICFAVLDGNVIGTAALLKIDADTFELAKMGVLKQARGNKAGLLLARHCIQKAKDLHAKKVILMSNTTLKPAINLYEKLGFRVTHLGPHPKYKRSDIQMELNL